MILITGGTGFIGSNFEDVIKLPRSVNLLNYSETLNGIRENTDIDSVIHTAGRIGGIMGNRAEKGRYFYENTQININVLEACRELEIRNVLSFSSSCAYPLAANLPYKEEDFHNGFPHEDHYGYAFSKRMLDIQARCYREQYGLNYTTVILSNVYGPKDHFGRDSGHVVPGLLNRCAKAKKYNQDFVVWGSGKPLRDFIYVDDVINLSKFLVKHYTGVLPINLGTPVETSIEEISLEIAKAFNFTGKIVFDTTKPDGQFRKPVDTSKLQKLLPNFRYISVREGIEKTVQWFIKNKYKEI